MDRLAIPAPFTDFGGVPAAAMSPSSPSSFRPEELLGALNDVEAKHAPAILYAMGDPTLLSSGRRVSIVGSRKASRAGLQRAQDTAQALVDADIVVVSGLALGIDAAAHTTAIRAGGRTIAVLGNPLNQVYPAANARLQAEIAARHLLVSQFAPGRPLAKGNWPTRNRTMALISDATIIIEAGESSGTLHQGWEALRLGRLLFLYQGLLENPALTWPAKMVAYGAVPFDPPDIRTLLVEIPGRVHGGQLTL